MILDIVAGAILFLSMLIAWFRGFIRETLTILGLIGAGVAALFGSPYVVPYIMGWLPHNVDEDGNEEMLMGMIPYDVIAIGLSYLLVFVIVYIIMSLFSHWLAKTAKELGLGSLDRSLGLLFGLGRAVILIGFLFIPFNVLLDDEEKADWFGEAISLPYVDYTARIMRAAIPSPLSDSDEDSDEDTPKDTDKKDDTSSEASQTSPMEALQNKAMQNVEDSLGILRDRAEEVIKPTPPKPSDKNGYSDQDRDALKNLFETQDPEPNNP